MNRRDPLPPLSVVPNLPGEVLGDAEWRDQRAAAMQVALACLAFHSEFGSFPGALSDALEVFDHVPREKLKLKRLFHFTDPATSEAHDWIYDSTVRTGSSDLLIASPKSARELRVVSAATGRGAIIEEDAYHQKTIDG